MGLPEGLLLALIAVLFLRPNELRSIARKAGYWISEMRRMSAEFTGELSREADLMELRETAREIEKDLDLSGALRDDELSDAYGLGEEDDYTMGDEPPLEIEAGAITEQDEDGGLDMVEPVEEETPAADSAQENEDAADASRGADRPESAPPMTEEAS